MANIAVSWSSDSGQNIAVSWSRGQDLWLSRTRPGFDSGTERSINFLIDFFFVLTSWIDQSRKFVRAYLQIEKRAIKALTFFETKIQNTLFEKNNK